MVWPGEPFFKNTCFIMVLGLSPKIQGQFVGKSKNAFVPQRAWQPLANGGLEGRSRLRIPSKTLKHYMVQVGGKSGKGMGTCAAASYLALAGAALEVASTLCLRLGALLRLMPVCLVVSTAALRQSCCKPTTDSTAFLCLL